MKTVPAFVIILISVAMLLTAHAGDTELLKFADGLYTRQMYALAAKEYENLLKEFPQSTVADMARFRLGESYRSLDRFSDADRVFRDIYIKHRQSPYRFRAGFRRADLHRRAGKLSDALVLYRLLVDDGAPQDISSAALYYSGEIHHDAGRIDESIADLERLCSDYDQSGFYIYALLKLGDIYSNTGITGGKKRDAIRKALDAYARVKENAVDARTVAESVFRMAEIYYRQKDYKKSAEFYKLLLRDYPDDQRTSEIGLQLAWSEYYTGFYAEALGMSDAAIPGAGHEKPEWLYIKANSERQLLKHSEAVRTYSELLKNFPGSEYAGPARYEKALSSYRSGDYNSAIREAEGISFPDGIKSESESALQKDIYWLLAESYAASGDTDRAVQYYRLIVTDYTDSDVGCDAAYRLAYHLQQKGVHLEAARHYGMVARKWPDSKLAGRALFASGVCLAKERNYEEAVRDWSELAMRYPDNPLVHEGLFQKGLTEIRLGKTDAALTSFNQVITKFPDSVFCADACYWRGVLFVGDGRLQDAEQSFLRALECSPREELAGDIMFNMALAVHKAGRTKESADLFEQLISAPVASKFTPELLEWLAGRWCEDKKYESSALAACLLSLRSEASWRQIGLVLLGRCSMAKGDAEAAGKFFDDALGLDVVTEYTAEAGLRSGDIHLASGRTDKAVAGFKRAAELAADESFAVLRANAYAGLGRAAELGGELEEAVKYFMIVAILYDDEGLVPECLHRAVNIFRKLGRDSEAEKTAAELKNRYPNSRFLKDTGSDSE